ncbi:MAG TPA: hypothetical protein VHB21_03430 [Minicystis sp.]|nr:hypothetical protein [Minicystis sp.]
MNLEQTTIDETTERDSTPGLIALARRLAEALEDQRGQGDDVLVACGVAWTLVDLLAARG